MGAGWPPHLPATSVRFARPTARLEACAAFYRDVLGLPVLAEFRGHDGYDGVVLGLPDRTVQLELTQRDGAPAPPDPTPEHQLVCYVGDEAALARAEARLREHGHEPVPPENPYWSRRGALAFTDPDGWVVIIAPWTE
jgi:catechol 2,3-dioxygenase-like lactoylglutathione lyase family enzyme